MHILKISGLSKFNFSGGVYFLDRVSIIDSLYQMNGFLGDALVFENDDIQKPYYLCDLPVGLLKERKDFISKKHLFIVTVNYGFYK